MYPGFRSLYRRIHSSPRLEAILGAFVYRNILDPSLATQHYHQHSSAEFVGNQASTCPSPKILPPDNSIDGEAVRIQTLLKTLSGMPIQEISRRLDSSNLTLSQQLVINVLKRHRSEWKTAHAFFCWIRDSSPTLSSDTSICNEIIDILGLAKRFDDVHQLLDEMSLKKKNLINEHTFATVVHRYAAAHRVDLAIDFFNKLHDFGLEPGPSPFQTLLLSLCRYKHVEHAEKLFLDRKTELKLDNNIKSWNIILNGWCVLRSLPDAKRVWAHIARSQCGPDKYTYSIFINTLCKLGKTTTSLDLLNKMWADGFQPDGPIYNTVIDGLCFKKRIPEALEIFNEMGSRGCPPNVITYNVLIKHMCKIRRMDKVNDLLREMEMKGGDCSPDLSTFANLLRAARDIEGVDAVLERMTRCGCMVRGDMYIMLLRLFVEWGNMERARCVWDEMELRGFGPDRRSYTIVVHGLYDRGMFRPALEWFNAMVAKGIEPEAKMESMAKDMKARLYMYGMGSGPRSGSDTGPAQQRRRKSLRRRKTQHHIY